MNPNRFLSCVASTAFAALAVGCTPSEPETLPQSAEGLETIIAQALHNQATKALDIVSPQIARETKLEKACDSVSKEINAIFREAGLASNIQAYYVRPPRLPDPSRAQAYGSCRLQLGFPYNTDYYGSADLFKPDEVYNFANGRAFSKMIQRLPAGELIKLQNYTSNLKSGNSQPPQNNF